MPKKQTAITKEPKTTNYLLARQELLYSHDELNHFGASSAIKKFLLHMANKSRNTAMVFKSRLAAFAQFVYRRHDKLAVDDFIADIKAGKHDVYEILSAFVSFLKTERTGQLKLSSNSVIAYTKTAKRFFRLSKVSINNEDFRDTVSIPRKEQVEKEALSKNDVIEILNACKDMRLKSFIMAQAVLGPRPIETCAVRLKDINFAADPARITFRAEFAKNRIQRTRFLTRELAQQLKLWLDVKYRGGRTRNLDDLIFANWSANGASTPLGIYARIRKEFAYLMDSTGRDKFEDNGRRRTITIYSTRRLVKTTISNQGFFDFSKWWLGHSLDADSTYFRQSEKDTIETFRKLESYLTFLDVVSLEAMGADIQTQIEQKDAQMRSMQEQMGLMMAYMTEPDPKKKAEISRKLIERGYMPKS